MGGNLDGLQYEDTELSPGVVDESAGLDTSQAPQQAGAIPENESDGLDTRKPRDPNATPTSGLLAAAEDTPPVQGIRKLVSYLMGGGAAPPQEAQRAIHEIKQTNPGISDDDANLLAVHQAGQMGGPAAAWGMVQYNRTAYNAKQSFAKAALNGIDGKAGDLAAAADAATKAGTHVIDGSTAVFSAGPDGITATVTDPDTRQRQQYKLTPQQFNDYLDVGKVGQWDKVMAQGIGPTLTGLAKSAPQSQDQGQAPQAAPTGKQPFKTNYGTTPSTMDLSNGEGRAPAPGEGDTNYGSELEARASAAYPWISQEGHRQQFMAAQENTQAERENKLGIADAGNQAKERIAAITGGARQNAAQTRATGEVTKQGIRSEGNRDVARIQAEGKAESDRQKAQLAIQKMEQQGSDAKMRERGRMARAEIMNPNFLLQNDEARNAILRKYGIAPDAPQAPSGAPQSAPQQGQPAGGARPQGIPPGAKQWNGKWYTRGPNGESVPVE